MRKILVWAAFALLACPAIVVAQTAEMHGPPRILEIVREDSKPGKAIAHRKHEAAWTQAFIKAGYPYSLTISSVTGPDQDWFMTGFDTYAQLEKVNDSFETNPAYRQIMETFSPKEADFVSESRFIFARYRPELSYKPDFKLGEYKYFSVLVVRFKLGSGPDEVGKIVAAAREKANPDYHSIAYEVTSGMPVGTYIYFTPVKSLVAWDEPPNKAYGDALKEGGFYDAVGKTVQLAESRLFAFNPRLSYVSDNVAKANPSFWHPKMETAKAPAAKKEMKTEKK
ncbi:MAG TPA: hypothetical protein VF840_08630 [Terriglobales bacterium]